MACGVGADQEQKWTEDPCWKEAARLCGWLTYERDRTLLFIHEARRVVGCCDIASRVRVTVGIDEVIANA